MTRVTLRPFVFLGRFFVHGIGIPFYRFLFWIRRHVDRIILPTRHRFFFLASNRFIIHFVVGLLVGFTAFMNVENRAVRAESFGHGNILSSLISVTDTTTVEVVTVEQGVHRSAAPRSYDENFFLDPTATLDFDFMNEDYATSIVDGAVSAPTIRGNAGSVAARTTIETYAVQDGDTLGDIAEKYGLSLSSLLWANRLTFRSIIRPGQSLVVPPVDGVIYTVKKGDTVAKIAKTYQSDADKIIAFNQLTDPGVLTIGARLIIPDGEPLAPPPRAAASASNVFTKTGASRSFAAGSGTWIWPTDWRVITQYFKGRLHTGLDIDGDYTTKSYAAADGVVIFSGWKGGYGYAVEIDHGNGFVTRYGHHSKLYVSKGDVVTAGQAIAQTGTTGRSTGTHLHFEVIKNGKFQNPLDYVR